MHVKVTSDKELEKFMIQLEKHVGKIEPLQIGYFEHSRYPDGKQVAEIAVHHEFGAPNAKIPARPTMRPAMKEFEKDLPQMIVDDAQENLHNPKQFAKRLPGRMGFVGAGLIHKRMARLKSPPLAESTLKRRRTRRVNRTRSKKPLIDTGQMRTSISMKVGNKAPVSYKDMNASLS